MIIELREALRRRLIEAVEAAQKAGELPAFELHGVELEHPQREEHGEWSSNVALAQASKAGMPPRKLAEVIQGGLRPPSGVSSVTVAGPGFLNFAVEPAWYQRQVEAILHEGGDYAALRLGAGRSVQVEYVSANPVGYLHVGHGRNAVLGDSVASVLEAAGYRVNREFYYNDTGLQMRHFLASLYARYAQALGRDEPMPEEGYFGHDVRQVAEQIASDCGPRFLAMPREEALPALGREGTRRIMERNLEDMHRLGVRHDTFFLEGTLYERGLVDQAVGLLRQRGYVEEREGAVWFLGSKQGLKKDDVLVRSTGEPGYFTTDIAYHYYKLAERGFDWVIDVWGADHAWHAHRLQAVVRAMGFDPSRVTVLLYQLVTLMRGGQEVKISKRTGETITLREVMDEVGPDATRFFLAQRSPDAHMEFDLDLAKEQSDRNPVYYVQYAHARIASIVRHASETGDWDWRRGRVELLEHPAELNLLRPMSLLPEIVETAALNLAPHQLTHYATDLAAAFHSFYRECRVVSSLAEDREITLARLKLVRAAQAVLARTLQLIGVAAPESM